MRSESGALWREAAIMAAPKGFTAQKTLMKPLGLQNCQEYCDELAKKNWISNNIRNITKMWSAS